MTVAREFEIAPYNFAAARRLERELGVSHVLAQVLVRRGLGDPEKAEAWLRADEHHGAERFAGMDEAVALVLSHVRARTRITVHGDYDVDGVCSTAILVRALRELGADVDWFLPSRTDDGYGLSLTTVDRLVARGTRLLLTVDCAITAVEEVAAARARGLDVVVTDHHHPRSDGRLPDAPIVHPALGGYPCPELCAAGVAHKFVEALARAAGASPALAEEDLDLVALATVADVVALRGENRRLVRAGLRALAVTRKPGLRALMRVSRTDPGSLDASCLGFRLGPRINAAGRIGRADAGVELLLTEDEERAEQIASELDSANHERRAVEREILWAAEAQAAELGPRPAYVLAGEGWHPGVVGIVASRIAERHHRPAVLIALQEGEGKGSGRSIPGFDLLAGLDATAEHLLRHGGHRAAAGLTIAADRVDAFRAAFEAHAEAVLRPEDLIARDRVDAVVTGSELGLELAEDLARLEPCGSGNPSVTLLVPAARCSDLRTMGEDGRHARFTVESGGARARAVSFGCDGRLPVPSGEPADLVVRLEAREWNGAVEPRLLLRDARPVRPGLIDVLGEPGPEEWLASALASARGEADPRVAAAPAGDREIVDRRGDGSAGLLADLVHSGERTLVVVADVSRRAPGLAARFGGFALCGWRTLLHDPALASGFVHVLALDPPAAPLPALEGGGWLHLAWGEEEVEFAARLHEREHDGRDELAAFYRELRESGELRGRELERALRGPGAHPRPAELAGRLVRILVELELGAFAPDVPALRLAGAEPTELSRSATWRALLARRDLGRRYLAEVA